MAITISSIIFSIFLTIYTIIKLKNKYLASFLILSVFAYVLVGPAISFFDLDASNRKIYFIYQPIVLVLFYIPFLFFTLIFNKSYSVSHEKMLYYKAPIFLPIILFIFLYVFIYVVIDNNLLFRRVGHEAYMSNNQLNIYQKAVYRLILKRHFL